MRRSPSDRSPGFSLESHKRIFFFFKHQNHNLDYILFTSLSKPVLRLQQQHRDNFCMPREPSMCRRPLSRTGIGGRECATKYVPPEHTDMYPPCNHRAPTELSIAFAVSTISRHCANNDMCVGLSEPNRIV